MVTLARRAHRIPFAPVVAVLFGTVAAILMAAVPQWMFEAGVVASGLPERLSAAAPPLGLAARILAMMLAFGGVSLLAWTFLSPLTRHLESRARARTPWRDAGYDTAPSRSQDDLPPPRRPIFAPEELGAPLMSDEAIASASAMASAIVEHDPELTMPVAVEDLQSGGWAPVRSDHSISALIRRLEEGLARRASNDTGASEPTGEAMPLSHGWIVSEDDNERPRMAGA